MESWPAFWAQAWGPGVGIHRDEQRPGLQLPDCTVAGGWQLCLLLFPFGFPRLVVRLRLKSSPSWLCCAWDCFLFYLSKDTREKITVIAVLLTTYLFSSTKYHPHVASPDPLLVLGGPEVTIPTLQMKKIKVRNGLVTSTKAIAGEW